MEEYMSLITEQEQTIFTMLEDLLKVSLCMSNNCCRVI